MSKSITIEEIPLSDERVAFVEAKPVGWAGFINVDTFHKELENQGIPEALWPTRPTPNKRLERAMKAQVNSRRVLIRPLSKSQGWSLVLEDDNELELEGSDRHRTAHSVDLTCRVKKVNDTSYVEATPWDHPNVASIKKEFERFDNVFKSSEDLSQWFSRKIIPWCNGVSTRSRGGSYYIMKGDYLERIQKVERALSNVSKTTETPVHIGDKTINVTKVAEGGRILLKPEVASSAAVEILVDNFINECEQLSEAIHAKSMTGNLGQRALRTQNELATAQIDKLQAVEDLLNTKLDDLRDSLNYTKEEVGIALLQAMGDD